jgi:hypothetical protein
LFGWKKFCWKSFVLEFGAWKRSLVLGKRSFVLGKGVLCLEKESCAWKRSLVLGKGVLCWKRVFVRRVLLQIDIEKRRSRKIEAKIRISEKNTMKTKCIL